MILGAAIFSIGAGLLHRFKVDTTNAQLMGAGNGMLTQQPLIAVQAVLSKKDIPIGTAMIAFWQSFGGALFVTMGQCVFNNKSIHNLHTIPPPNFSTTNPFQSGPRT